MRRWISALVIVLMLANVAMWPATVVAEAFGHDRAVLQLDDQTAPVESGTPNCQYGCSCHCCHHFQFQVPALSYQPAPLVVAAAFAGISALPLKHVLELPFRPPLAA